MTNESNSTLTLLLACLNPVLILCGWYFIRTNTTVFAVRAEMNTIAKEITNITDKMLERCLSYWVDENTQYTNQSYEVVMLNDFHTIINKQKILKRYHEGFNKLPIVSLKQKLTLESKFDTQEKNEIAFREIAAAIASLNLEIDNQIAKKRTLLNLLMDRFPRLMGQLLSLAVIIGYLMLVILFFKA